MSVTFDIECSTEAILDAVTSEGAPELNCTGSNAILILEQLSLHAAAADAMASWPCGSIDPDTILAVSASAIYRGAELHQVARAAKALGLMVGYC